ncbi:hypothetical protein SAY86_004376 [Trapa natans]|uniref:RING-type E3 ubiquitin transferase n=1 Tax=Trapa natans TaxID=22666 RepID=A0AAN7RFK2_TRANT|nr:hypothetical protein SAY86_004376 [Trapa natans]
METENPVDLAHLQSPSLSFCDLGLGGGEPFSPSAFRDYSSDQFPSSSTQARWRLLAGCTSVPPTTASDSPNDGFISQLVSDLASCSIEEQRLAVMEIRLLAKNNPNDRYRIAQAGAIKPLISIISSASDPILQEHSVTAILNLSLCDENKEAIVALGAVKPLVKALRVGTSTAKENAACALLRLSQMEQNKAEIGRSGAIPPLVSLLEGGGPRGKNDAATALYSLCSLKENKVRAVQAGLMKTLVELMADLESTMVDKAAFVASVLVTGLEEARAALVEEGGIPVLVEIVEVGSQRQKEIAVVMLLELCEDSAVYRTMVVREGAVPPLVALSQSRTRWAKQKTEKLIELLRKRSSDGGGS